MAFIILAQMLLKWSPHLSAFEICGAPHAANRWSADENTGNTLEHDSKTRTICYMKKTLKKTRIAVIPCTFTWSVQPLLNCRALNHQITQALNCLVTKHWNQQSCRANLTLNFIWKVKSEQRTHSFIPWISPGNRSLTCVTRFACPQACVWSQVEGPTPMHTHTHAPPCRLL